MVVRVKEIFEFLRHSEASDHDLKQRDVPLRRSNPLKHDVTGVFLHGSRVRTEAAAVPRRYTILRHVALRFTIHRVHNFISCNIYDFRYLRT